MFFEVAFWASTAVREFAIAWEDTALVYFNRSDGKAARCCISISSDAKMPFIFRAKTVLNDRKHIFAPRSRGAHRCRGMGLASWWNICIHNYERFNGVSMVDEKAGSDVQSHRHKKRVTARIIRVCISFHQSVPVRQNLIGNLVGLPDSRTRSYMPPPTSPARADGDYDDKGAVHVDARHVPSTDFFNMTP